MKSLRCFAFLSLFLVGCGDIGPKTPQQQAAALLDEEIEQIQDQIKAHLSYLPNDHQRWGISAVKVNEDLYNRLDDLFRQRQLLAKEAGKQQDFTPREATTSTTVIQQTSTPKASQ